MKEFLRTVPETVIVTDCWLDFHTRTKIPSKVYYCTYLFWWLGLLIYLVLFCLCFARKGSLVCRYVFLVLTLVAVVVVVVAAALAVSCSSIRIVTRCCCGNKLFRGGFQWLLFRLRGGFFGSRLLLVGVGSGLRCGRSRRTGFGIWIGEEKKLMLLTGPDEVSLHILTKGNHNTP